MDELYVRMTQLQSDMCKMMIHNKVDTVKEVGAHDISLTGVGLPDSKDVCAPTGSNVLFGFPYARTEVPLTKSFESHQLGNTYGKERVMSNGSDHVHAEAHSEGITNEFVQFPGSVTHRDSRSISRDKIIDQPNCLLKVRFQTECVPAILHLIQAARFSIRMMVFSFDNELIVQEIVTALRRWSTYATTESSKCSIHITVDRSQLTRPRMQKQLMRVHDAIQQCGIQGEVQSLSGKCLRTLYNTPKFDDRFGSMHNKCMIVDDHATVTGSFNYTNVAHQCNFENIVVIHNTQCAALYIREMDNITQKSHDVKPIYMK
jgi:phosphatidylserine/phosphatidylglycerophosphate/cardiolipin synthase-like enzyme